MLCMERRGGVLDVIAASGILLWACTASGSSSGEQEMSDTQAAVQKHMKGLQDKDPKTRAEAAHELGFIGPPAKAAVPALVDCLKDRDESVRGRAAIALGFIGAEASKSIPVLIDTLGGKT